MRTLLQFQGCHCGRCNCGRCNKVSDWGFRLFYSRWNCFKASVFPVSFTCQAVCWGLGQSWGTRLSWPLTFQRLQLSWGDGWHTRDQADGVSHMIMTALKLWRKPTGKGRSGLGCFGCRGCEWSFWGDGIWTESGMKRWSQQVNNQLGDPGGRTTAQPTTRVYEQQWAWEVGQDEVWEARRYHQVLLCLRCGSYLGVWFYPKCKGQGKWA